MASGARRWVVRGLVGLILLCAILLLALAAFPWAWMKGPIERRLSDRIGKPVTIGAMAREDSLSFHPVVTLRDLRVPQPGWVKPTLPDLARIGEIRAGFSVWGLLTGGPVLERLEARRARLHFYRDAQGRENWSGERSKGSDRRGGRPALHSLIVADSRIAYRDDKRGRSVDAALTVDPSGLRLSGSGDVRGHAVTVTATGGPILDSRPGQRWPFDAAISGDAVGFTLKGTMDGPLDIGHLRGEATAHGTDLALLDAIIEAGLPGTQPVRLTARVTRDRPDWIVEGLKGTIGRSDIAGHATIRKRDGRTRIDGALSADRFDFDDLSSNAGKAKAAAKRAQLGPRLIPDTAIDLATVDHTDGKLDLKVRQLLWPGPSPFRSLHGTISLERSQLSVEPLMLGLTRGTLSGRIGVDQRDGSPLLDIAMAMRNARLLDFFPDARIDGALIGRVAIKGRGKTIRQALGTSTGTIALVARDGRIPDRTAALMGQDVGRGLTLSKRKEAVLRCIITRLDVRDGIARPGPVLIDTSRAQTHATGTIRLSDERLALALSGVPKQDSLLRLKGSVPVGGTIKTPDIQLPKDARSAKGIIRMIGDAIGGEKQPTVGDADCDSLARTAMR
ncbi:AsmA family protein [Sphingobium yanoikuyae]|uniref:AsmA family protein n=1 Tax=Sphingobium yanoikuyae TaxID=13690 RepID=UPI0028AC4EAE|nr:AsmA-like C-terminal region-containing protein [Sphingobium yanoikuyae]